MVNKMCICWQKEFSLICIRTFFIVTDYKTCNTAFQKQNFFETSCMFYTQCGWKKF